MESLGSDDIDIELAEAGASSPSSLSLSEAPETSPLQDIVQDVVPVENIEPVQEVGPIDEVGPLQVVGEPWTDVGLTGVGLTQDMLPVQETDQPKSITTSPIVSRKTRTFAQTSPTSSVSLMTGIFDELSDRNQEAGKKKIKKKNGLGGCEEWVCPVHGDKCGEVCSAEEFVYSKHKWTLWKCITGVPYRISYFFTRKFFMLKNWLQPPDLYDPNLRRDLASQPFLELKVTFNPSRELAILYYFQALSAQKRLGVQIEFEKIDKFLENGADINAKDRSGKTVLHAACREEQLDVIQYLIDKGSAINTMDKNGRTPLHMAAAMENYSIISYLIECKADYGAITHGDIQTPLHYAAKNDAPAACKILIEHGAKLESRDFRGRTPLLLAAELDRSVAASTLLDCGASAKILDYTGYHPVCAMIENMPDVALRGLDQFYDINKTSRQEFFWLNYLEPRLISGEGISFPSPSVLEEVVKTHNQDLIKHPVVKEMIKTKWSQFGIFGCIYDLLQYFFTLIVWSLMVLLKPFDQESFDEQVYLTIIEILGIILFIYQFIEEVIETWEGFKAHRDWKNWKMQQIQADLSNVLPENVEEKIYLEDMEEVVINTRSPYWSDVWNIFDWVLLLLLLLSFVLYTIDLLSRYQSQEWKLGLWKSIFLTLTLTVAWAKMFKYMKVFETMGPFVVIVTNTFSDILKITFVYFVLYIPAACIFYQFYGKSDIPAYSEDIFAVFFTVFRMIVVDDYGYQDLIDYSDKTGISRSWTHFLIAYWLLASSIILLNLFIALMSDTFQRIYDKAIEVAALQRAQTIVGLEKKLSYNRREQFLKYIKKNFAPKITYIENDIGEGQDQGLDLVEGKLSSRTVTKSIVEQVAELSEAVLVAPIGALVLDEASEDVTEIKLTFEEQEMALRKAFNKLSVMTA